MKQDSFWTEIYNRTNKFYNLIFVLSATAMTWVLTLNYSVIIKYDYYNASDYQVNFFYAAAASIIMLPIYWYMAYKKDFVRSLLRTTTPGKGWGSFAYSVVLLYQLLQDSQDNFEHIVLELQRILPAVSWDSYRSLIYGAVLPGACALSFAGLFVFALKGANIVVEFLYELVSKADRREKLFFKIMFVACLSVICFFYARTHMQWSNLDLIYQTDCTFVYEHYYPVFSNGFAFDWDIGNGGIRHPLTTLFTYPIYIVAGFFSNLLFFIPNIRPLLYAVIQSVLLIITVILLKRIIKNEWIYLIFPLSFSFTFFVIFVEKYQLATFFVVAYVYYVVTYKGSKREMAEAGMVGAAGTMITSAWLGFFWGKEKTIKGRLKEYTGLLLRFLAVLVGTGRFYYLWGFGYLIDHNFLMFNGRKLFSGLLNLSPVSSFCAAVLPLGSLLNIPLFDRNLEMIPMFVQKLCAFFNLLGSCFIPVPYTITKSPWDENVFFWRSLKGEINVFGVVLFILMIIIFIRHRKEKPAQIFSMWILWAIIQFVVIGFSAGCSPLFALYFAWAAIPMLLIGMKDVLKTPLQQLCGYGALALVMLYTNFMHLHNLYVYMITEGPL